MSVAISLDTVCGIYITDRTAFVQLHTCVEITQLAHIVIILIDRFAGHRVGGSFCQFHDLVVIAGECKVAVPGESAPFVTVSQSQLDTFIADASTLDIRFGISG